MAQIRASKVRQKRQEAFAALTTGSQLSLFGGGMKDCEELKPQPEEKWTFVNQKKEETKHRTEWCAESSRYRCMRCGRGSKYIKDTMRPKIYSNDFGFFF